MSRPCTGRGRSRARRRSCRAGDETNRLPGSQKMTTLHGNRAETAPTSMVVSRARHQLAIAWANILLQRPAPATGALNRPWPGQLPEATQADLRARRACCGRSPRCCSPDRVEAWMTFSPGNVEADTLPRESGTAGNTAALAAICVRRKYIHCWTGPRPTRNDKDRSAPFMRSTCAAWRQESRLDIVAALHKEHRTAFEVGTAKWGPTRAAQLAGSLLAGGALPRPRLAEAGRLMDEICQVPRVRWTGRQVRDRRRSKAERT